MVLKIRLVLFLSKRIENNISANAGIKRIPIKSADNKANVLVNANGRNSFPSAACQVNTGRKLTTVVAKAVITAEATSVAPL